MSQSPVFEGMFDGGNDGAGEGATDEKPIVLEGYKSNDFECLFKVLLPRPLDPCPPALSQTEWASALKLSTVWQMEKIRNVAIERLSSCTLSPTEKIQYSRKFRVSKWLFEGVTALATDIADIEVNDLAKPLGWKTAALVFAIRDKAKPKLPESNNFLHGLKCYNHGNQVSHIGAYLMCSTSVCAIKVNASRVTSNDTTGKLAVSEDVVSTMFEDEIKALQA
ncbi:hypothetical protein BKA70DRAFT_271835 [Coprinopsis sp. MPI-PUGE-AT-0042]|nr:hypothetical protein BKA70DRAFT_271835 [Coprinopsis sp. MPI-PUGE-AT-0042]